MNLSYKRFKYRLYPNKVQEAMLQNTASGTRWLWNYMLEKNITQYNSLKTFIFKYKMINLLPSLKTEYIWLKTLSDTALAQKCIDLDKAIKNCYKNKRGFPKFKRKSLFNDSFREASPCIYIKHNRIKIPKIGLVKYDAHRPFIGKIKNITIKYEYFKWWVIICCETPQISPILHTTIDNIVGIDLGIKTNIVTSDGEIFDKPKNLKLIKRLKRQQRIFCRRRRGSKNKFKQRKKVNRCYERISNKNKNYINQTINSITKNYDIVCMENLNVKGMLKNRHMSSNIHQASWSTLTSKLRDTFKFNGKYTVKVDRFFPSSKTCCFCSNKKDVLKLNERVYRCSCGNEMDRDLNAALNIRKQGIKIINRAGVVQIYACGDTNIGELELFNSRYVS